MIANGDTIEVISPSGVRATAGTNQLQMAGGNEPLGSRAVVTGMSGIVDYEIWYQGTWSVSGRTGYIRGSRVAKTTSPPAPVPTPPPAPIPTPPASSSLLSTLIAGTARALGSYINPIWPSAGRWITDDSGTVFDTKRHQLLIFGGSHGPSQEDDIRALDTWTCKWTSLYPSTPRAEMLMANLDMVRGVWLTTGQPVARHTYGLQVVRGDVYHCLAIYCNPDNLPEGTLPRFNGKMFSYDMVAGTFKYSKANAPWYHASGSVLDPVSGNIYVIGLGPQASPGQLWKYDPVADVVSGGVNMAANTQPVDLVHCPLDDKFYLFEMGGGVRRITIDRNDITRSVFTVLAISGTKPNAPRPNGYPTMSWDGNQFGGCFYQNRFYTFNPITFAWSSTPMQIEAGSPQVADVCFNCSEFDATTGCYVFMQTASTIAQSWAYRPL